MKTKPVSELLDEIYLEAENKQEIDYYAAISSLVMESIESRYKKGISQKELAAAMGTMQSAISRFENMGREPGFKFLVRMAQALGHSPGVTLYGEYMATVNLISQDQVKEIANKNGMSEKTFVQKLLDEAVKDTIDKEIVESRMADDAMAYSMQIECGSTTLPAKNMIEKMGWSLSNRGEPDANSYKCEEVSSAEETK